METVACSLTQKDQATRRDRWVALGDRALRRLDTTDTGLQLGFTRAPGVEVELSELAELERECCTFADWTVETDGDAVTLRVEGRSPMAVDAVHAMFGPSRQR